MFLKLQKFFVSVLVIIALSIAQNAVSAQTSPPRKTLYLPNGANPIPKGVFEPNWDSIKKNYKTPNWFRAAKFGIMMHWGLYAVPAKQSEWYATHMYNNTEIIRWHQEHFGMQDKFGYKDFISDVQSRKV